MPTLSKLLPWGSRNTVQVRGSLRRNYAAAVGRDRVSGTGQHALDDVAQFAVSRVARARVSAALSLLGTSFPPS